MQEFLPYAWFEGKCIPFKDAKVSIATHALHYGTAAFGGMRAIPNPSNKDEFLLFRTDNIVEHGYHIDFIKKPKDLYTSILYLNTNNGYTKFKKGVIVNSLRNRLIKFPNEKEHTGSTNNCEEPYRLVLNINYTL